MAKLIINTFWNQKQKSAFRYLLDNNNWITDVWYGWGAGGWKSYLWCMWQWMMRNKYPWTRGFFWRKELKRLKQTTLATYYKFCEDYQIPKTQRWILNSQDWVIKFANWSEILLLDLSYMPSDPLYQRFGSLELTDGFADEIAEIDSQCLMILKTRIWRQKNEEYNLLPKFLWTFNPDKWHVYRDYYKADKDWRLPNYRVFIKALATDNKKLPKVYIEQLRKADRITQERLLYWNFEYDDTPWRLFEYNAILNLWDNVPINWDKFISWDIARKWKDQSIIWFWNWLELFKIIKEPISDLKLLSEKIKKEAQYEEVEMRNTIIDENWVGWWVIDNLRCQWFINNAKPLQVRKTNLQTVRNYENLKTQCYYKLADYVNWWKIKISVDDDEFKEKLIEELDVIIQIDLDKDWKNKIIKKEDIIAKLGRSPDYSDMLMMRMYYELQKLEENEEEISIEIDDDPLWIFNDDTITEDEIILDPY